MQATPCKALKKHSGGSESFLLFSFGGMSKKPDLKYENFSENIGFFRKETVDRFDKMC